MIIIPFLEAPPYFSCLPHCRAVSSAVSEQPHQPSSYLSHVYPNTKNTLLCAD